MRKALAIDCLYGCMTYGLIAFAADNLTCAPHYRKLPGTALPNQWVHVAPNQTGDVCTDIDSTKSVEQFTCYTWVIMRRPAPGPTYQCPLGARASLLHYVSPEVAQGRSGERYLGKSPQDPKRTATKSIQPGDLDGLAVAASAAVLAGFRRPRSASLPASSYLPVIPARL